MFTGIVTHRGRLLEIEKRGHDRRLRFETDPGLLEDCDEGDSIACSGVCLTALDISNDRFSADASVETLSCTTIGHWEPGQEVNLERPLPADGRFDGHMVSGHVDGLAELVSQSRQARSLSLVFLVDRELSPYIAPKGSVCLDGVSLTVNEVEDTRFSVNIIPHTQSLTGFAALAPGQQVNIEVDIVARYLQRLLEAQGVIPK